MDLTIQDIEELETAERELRFGEWQYGLAGSGWGVVSFDQDDITHVCYASEDKSNFIAKMRNRLPSLLKAARAHLEAQAAGDAGRKRLEVFIAGLPVPDETNTEISSELLDAISEAADDV